MKHPRTTILDAAMVTLQGAKLNVGDKVHRHRVTPVWAKDIPCCLVALRGESIDDKNSRPRTYFRTAELHVAFIHNDEDGVDDVQGESIRAAEFAILRDESLAGTVDDVRYLRMESPVIEGDGNKVYAATVLVFEVDYQDQAPEGERATDLESMDVTYQMGDSDTPDAEDEVDLTEG
ncbi:hypothetical protein KQI63_15845 [bacterium]|nr:hypothetical protein [bacterium]